MAASFLTGLIGELWDVICECLGQDITNTTEVTEAEHKSEFKVTKGIPYLILKDDL